MADNVMMNEGALQQQGFREEDYQEEILRLRGQLVASQQAERLAMEQLGTLLPCERRAVIWRVVSNEKPIIVKNISYFRNYF